MREYSTKMPIPYSSLTEAEFLFAETFQGMIENNIFSKPPFTRAYKTPELTLLGNYSLKCLLDPTYVAANEDANISRSAYIRRSPKMSASVYLAFMKDDKNSIANLAYWINNKTKNKLFGFEFGINLKTLEVVVYNQDSNWQVLGTANLTYEKYFYLLEGIFDTDEGKYISVKVGDSVFDASGISAYSRDPFNEVGAVSCILRAKEDGCKGVAYFGSVIVRQIIV